ncbi:Sialin like protein [Argiope bruennichi]|uniref:Sialin like protein n=1 Tax=Argiope bruennichi TaxID=94029 RepID=A0A8T0F7C4_ARGBR|nr:Sialin like protein [Argiope bruennichi]
MQVDVNVVILAMSSSSRDSGRNTTSSYVECPMLQETGKKSITDKYPGPRYDWSPKEQGIILGSFYYGYLFTILPGGYLAQKFSPKWVFGLGVFFSAMLSLLTPTATAMGVIALVTLRILQGLSQGVTKPAINAIISRWSPKLERSRFSTFTMSGGLIGSVIAMPLSGVISSCSTLGGWPTVFTFFECQMSNWQRILGCVWFVFWLYFIKDSPLDHPNISLTEFQKFDRTIEEITTKLPGGRLLSPFGPKGP